MATKTLNWGSTGVTSSQVNNVASTTSTGFVSTSIASSSSTYRGFEISLPKVCGTANVKINSVKVTWKAQSNKTSSSYYPYNRVYCCKSNAYARDIVYRKTGAITSSGVTTTLTINEGAYSGDYSANTTVTYPWNSRIFTSTITGDPSIEFAINIYSRASSTTVTVTDVSVVIDYTPDYGYITFDSEFSFLKWKDKGITGDSHLTVSNLTNTGFTATNTNSSGEGYTNTSDYYLLPAGNTYTMEYDSSGDSSREVFYFGSANGSSWLYPDSSKVTKFNFTVRQDAPYIAHRCDVNTAGKVINYSNFRVYPYGEDFRGSTVPAEYRSCFDAWRFPPEPTRDGYKFLGWADKNGKYYTSSSALPTTDLVLYSQWELAAPPKFMEASMKYNSSQISSSNKVPTGANFILSIKVQ